MSYIRKLIQKTIEQGWNHAKTTIERTFLEIDAETKKIQTETDRFHALSEIVRCSITNDYGIVFDNDGGIVTTE